MGLVSFTVFVKDEAGAPIPNADGQLHLEIFEATGQTRLQSIPSTVDGELPVTIDGDAGGTLYNLKVHRTSIGAGLYSQGHLNLERVSHRVYDPLPAGIPTNDAYITINTGTLQPSPDPNFCRITGQFLRHDGRPYPGYAFSIHERRIPKAIHQPVAGGLSGALLIGDRIDLRTDKDGLVIFDLPRGGIYTIVMDDWRAFNSEEPLLIVPDAPQADFVDLLLVYPASVQYSTTTVNILVGEEAEVEVTEMLLSNSLTGPPGGADCLPESYLEPVVTAGVGNVDVAWKSGGNGRTLSITGLLAGPATVSLELKDPSETGLSVRLPKPPLSQTPITITVS